MTKWADNTRGESEREREERAEKPTFDAFLLWYNNDIVDNFTFSILTVRYMRCVCICVCLRVTPPCNNNKLLQFNLYNCWNIICWSRANTGSVPLINVYFYCTKRRARCAHCLMCLLSSSNYYCTRTKWLHKSQSKQRYILTNTDEKKKIMISFRTKKIAPTIPFPTMSDWLLNFPFGQASQHISK